MRRPLIALLAAVSTIAGLAGACGDGADTPAAIDEPDRQASTSAPAPTEPGPEPELPATGDFRALSDAACRSALSLRTTGTLPADLTSVSGLAASWRNPGVIWAIEDSLEPAEVTALDLDGNRLAVLRLAGGPFMNLDWEGLAVGPGPDGRPWIHIADTGDNFGLRSSVRFHRFPEPDVGDATITPETVTARAESGRPNIEAFLVDGDGTYWTIDKDPGGPAAIRALEDGVLVERGRVDLPGEQVTAMDLSPDGSVLALRTHRRVRLYPVPAGGDPVSALAGEGCTGPDPGERQGESIALLMDATGVVTVSEDESGRPVDLHLSHR